VKVLVIFCHPRVHSFNHAVAARVVQTLAALRHSITFHDLYRENFDPILEESELRRGLSFDRKVLHHIQELEGCDALVVIHPDWWGQPPAMLKGWIDRVLQPGVAYEFDGPEFMKKRKKPLLAEKKALVFATSDGRKTNALLESVWIEGVFRFCGMNDGTCHILYELRDLERSARLRWLDRVEEILTDTLPADSSA
jgi:NAD(P)H dehydrogenase (quinone)